MANNNDLVSITGYDNVLTEMTSAEFAAWLKGLFDLI